MKFIDMFSGMGTVRMGFEQAGHECVYSIEWDKHKRKIYEVIFGHEPESSDIRSVRADNLPHADCWTFGAPCQDFSIAGTRSGLEGDRSSLVREVFRLVRETKEEHRPEWLLYENVKGMLSSNKGLDYLEILFEMESLGYDIEWQLLNSKDFGVPQNRERVFTLGHLRERSARKVFPIERASGENPQKITREERVTNVPCTIDKGKGMDSCSLTDIGKETANCLCSRDYKGLRRSFNVVACLTPDRSEKRQNGRRFKEPGEPMFTLTKQDIHGVVLKQLIPGSDAQRVYDSNGLGRTIKAEGGGQGAKTGLYQVGTRIRRLTPRECMRLQGVPDYITDKLIESGISDTQLYRAAGDACTVNVIYEIASRMSTDFKQI